MSPGMMEGWRCGWNPTRARVLQNTESGNHLGWKDPLRSWSSTVKPALACLPLNHVPSVTFTHQMNTSRGGDFAAALGSCATA